MDMLVIGGDERYIRLADLAHKRGWRVHTVGLHGSSAWLGDPEIVVLPNPWRRPDGTIPAPLSETPIYWNELAPVIADCSNALIVCGGSTPGDDLHALAAQHGLILLDLFKDEAFARANAVSSAEGAIYYAMQCTDFTIHGSRCLVIGYGRIGELLASKLRSLGAEVCVAARRMESRTWARCHGHTAVAMDALPLALGDRQLIFNTAPQLVLGENELRQIQPAAHVFDLASPPYGTDFDIAQELGVHAQLEPNIPGRYSPATAAETLLDSIEGAYFAQKGG